jgi:hypothetical protein
MSARTVANFCGPSGDDCTDRLAYRYKIRCEERNQESGMEHNHVVEAYTVAKPE